MTHLRHIETTTVKISGRLLRTARLDAETHQFLLEPRPVIEGLRRLPERIDIFTFMQALPETRQKYGYLMEWDNLAVLPISTFDNWWSKQIGFKARNKARQGEKKGIVIREVPFDQRLARGIWEIYNESPVRQGRRFPHFGKDLETVHREAATYLDHSIFIGAYQDEELIGFIKLVTDETRVQAGLMHIVSKIQYRDKAPTNALVAHAVKACADRGIGHLVYGRYAYGKKQHDGLAEFKERNGFQRINVPRYYVPLSPFGQLALRMGFHRRLVDRFPESVTSKLRDFRNNWYNRKIHHFTEAT